MRRQTAVRPVLLHGQHVEPGAPHAYSKRFDLAGKGGRGLSDVVHPREEPHQPKGISLRPRQSVSHQPPDRPGYPPLPQLPSHSRAVGHVPPQRKPALRIMVMLRPRHSRRRGQPLKRRGTGLSRHTHRSIRHPEPSCGADTPKAFSRCPEPVYGGTVPSGPGDIGPLRRRPALSLGSSSARREPGVDQYEHYDHDHDRSPQPRRL